MKSFYHLFYICILITLIFISCEQPTSYPDLNNNEGNNRTIPGDAILLSQPSYGSATVDGDPSEWNLTEDLFANMFRFGNPTQVKESNLFFRYDCATSRMYVLVLPVENVLIIPSVDTTWIAIDGAANKVTFTEFSWVPITDNSSTLGFEASFDLPAGNYKIIANALTLDNGEEYISSTDIITHNDGIPIDIICQTQGPSIFIEKQGPTWANKGDEVTFNYTVLNTGDVPLGNITVTDDKCGIATYVSGDTNVNDTLDLTEIWIFECSYTPEFTFPEPLVNIATVEGSDGQTTVSAISEFTLFPFILRKNVLLYWEGENIEYDDPDTEFTVQLKKGDTVHTTFSISEAMSKELWLSDGNYKFCEVDLPFGYESAYGCIAYTTGQGYPDWTHINVITFDLELDKWGPDYACAGDTITYFYKVTNDGPAAIEPLITDNKCEDIMFVGGDTNGNSLIDSDEEWMYECDYVIEEFPVTNIAIVKDANDPREPGYWWLGGDRDTTNNIDTWTVSEQCNYKSCSHGFWKNHTDEWPNPYTPADSINSVFDSPYYGGYTLLEGHQFGGGSGLEGGARILFKQAIASVLNEARYGSDFPPFESVNALVDEVNYALNSGNRQTMISLAEDLDYFNNIGDCE